MNEGKLEVDILGNSPEAGNYAAAKATTARTNVEALMDTFNETYAAFVGSSGHVGFQRESDRARAVLSMIREMRADIDARKKEYATALALKFGGMMPQMAYDLIDSLEDGKLHFVYRCRSSTVAARDEKELYKMWRKTLDNLLAGTTIRYTISVCGGQDAEEGLYMMSVRQPFSYQAVPAMHIRKEAIKEYCSSLYRRERDPVLSKETAMEFARMVLEEGRDD